MHGYKVEKSKVKQSDGNFSEGSKVHVICATANIESDAIRMCVKPIFVRCKLSNCIVKTIAMLDNCSKAK